MKKYLNKMTDTFTFSDDFGETKNLCETKISIELKTYDDGRKFYYVNYTHTIIYPNGNRKLCLNLEDIETPNPFSDFGKFKENFEDYRIQYLYGTLTEKTWKKKIMKDTIFNEAIYSYVEIFEMFVTISSDLIRKICF